MGEFVELGVFDWLWVWFGWLDYVVCVFMCFNDCNGSFFVVGFIYYMIFVIFFLLMVGFGVGGFVLLCCLELLIMFEECICILVFGVVG